MFIVVYKIDKFLFICLTMESLWGVDRAFLTVITATLYQAMRSIVYVFWEDCQNRFFSLSLPLSFYIHKNEIDLDLYDPVDWFNLHLRNKRAGE